MADDLIPITLLDPLVGASQGTDLLVIVDGSDLTQSAQGTTKKMTAQALRTDMFAGYGSDDPITTGAITATGNSTITGTLGGISTLTATTVTATNLGGTLSTAAQANVTSVGTLTSLSVGAGGFSVTTVNSYFNAGTDITTNLLIGNGGAAPSGSRSVTLQMNAPSSVTYPGAATLHLLRADSTLWMSGIDSAASGGTKGATTDYFWYNGSAYVASLSTAGALTLAAGLTAASVASTGTLSALGNAAVGAALAINPIGWTRMVQVAAAGNAAFSLLDTATTAQQWDIVVNAKNFEIFDVTNGMHTLVINPVTGAISMAGTFATNVDAGIQEMPFTNTSPCAGANRWKWGAATHVTVDGPFAINEVGVDTWFWMAPTTGYAHFLGGLTYMVSISASTNLTVGGVTSLGGAGGDVTTVLNLPLGTTARSSLRIAHGAARTSPIDGDIWTTTTGVFARVNGVTKNLTDVYTVPSKMVLANQDTAVASLVIGGWISGTTTGLNLTPNNNGVSGAALAISYYDGAGQYREKFGVANTVSGLATLELSADVGPTHVGGTFYTDGVVGARVATSATTSLNIAASTTGISSLRILHGVAPTSPVNGDIWTTTAALFARINGVTVTLDNNANNLTGTTLNSAVVTSSLTAIGTLTTLRVNGTIGVNTAPSAGIALYMAGTINVATGYGYLSQQNYGVDTTNVNGIYVGMQSNAGATIAAVYNFRAGSFTLGGGTTLAAQYGFYCNALVTGTVAYAFYGVDNPSAFGVVSFIGTTAAVAASTIAIGGITRTTIGANGGATALTALPLGYIDIYVAGTAAQIPYYNRGA